MSQAPAGTATFAGFAKMLGVGRSYITQLRADGRLVLTDDGKRVVVDASRDRVRESADPAKTAVVARHAAARADDHHRQPEAASAPPTHAQAPDDRVGSTYQASRAVRERYLALEAKRAYDVAIGKLLDAGEVQSVTASAATALRTALENLPTHLAPQLAASSDEAYIRALMADGIAHALNELSRQFDSLSKQAPQ